MSREHKYSEHQHQIKGKSSAFPLSEQNRYGFKASKSTLKENVSRIFASLFSSITA